MTTLVRDSGRKTPARLASSTILACQPDQRLVKLVRSGHERAFDAIVQRYRGQLVRYCRRILPDSRCEDAVQQAFINAHAAILASDEPVQVKAWLFAITRNAALNMLRQNGWNYEQIPLDFDGVRRPDQVFDERTELEQTVAALKELPERQRDALVMREFEGRSYDEIAIALGTGDGAVRQLLNRARAALRSAASALIPSSLVERAASIASGDGGGMAQIVGGLGAAGAAKAGVAALVAGSLVVGVAKAPLPIGESYKTTREKATLSPGKPRSGKVAAPVSSSDNAAASLRPAPRTHALDTAGSPHSGGRETAGSGSHRSGSTPGDSSGRSGSDDGRRSSDTREHSGSDGSGSSGSGSSGSGETQPTDDHSGTSGGHGSDDAVTAVVGSDDVSGSSGSGSSGSGSSGSGSSGSGVSGSGSGSSGSPGETTSTPTDSGSSGSGSSSDSSGSGSSGSGSRGSDDALVH